MHYRLAGLITISIILVVIIVILIAIPSYVLDYGSKKTYTDINKIPQYNVGIVLGAGVNPDKTPSPMLEDRLITAAQLYKSGKIKKILVSGDNSEAHYNEPQVMYNYLIDVQQIPAVDVVRDFAGFRTYDTCARAKNIWGLDQAIMISQGYHLYRAIYTCDQLGLEATGFSATLRDYLGEESYKTREILAIYKSFIDLYIIPPGYTGGPLETDFNGME